jgi:hypothetical protein
MSRHCCVYWWTCLIIYWYNTTGWIILKKIMYCQLLMRTALTLIAWVKSLWANLVQKTYRSKNNVSLYNYKTKQNKTQTFNSTALQPNIFPNAMQRHQFWTPNNLHSPSTTAAKVTAVLSSNHIYLLRTVLYWLKPPYTTARVSVTNVKLCHDLPSGLSWNGCIKLSNKQAHTDLIPTVWDVIRYCWDKGSWCSEGQWHLHLTGWSKFLDCLTLQVTML